MFHVKQWREDDVFQPDLWRVLLLLLTLGILYNQLVGYVQEQLPDRHGVTAFMVVGGVTWTLLGVLLLEGVTVFLTVLLCFCASGLPMIWGSMRRYQRGEA